MNLNAEKHSQLIKKKAEKYGFISCGISKAEFLEEEAPRLENWLNNNANGKMQYMENHFDKRLDPSELVEGAKSVVSLLYNYFPEENQKENTFKVSKYAYGQDYHHVIKKKLRMMMEELNEEIGEINGRVFVDSAPVLEKAWAAKSGLGWIGKHSNLLTKQRGSFYFISELIIDLPLAYDTPVTDHCGSCTKCIDACPTQAITPYQVDGSKCISYLTIELKEEIPSDFKNKFEDWMFGCDICQDVCPWNRFSKPHNEPLFNPHPDLLDYKKEDWTEITKDVFNEIFRKSAVKRTKYEGLKRNINYILKD
ncbi:tRNA epoxyqueuosine(34) reductase QueG [Psychroflexus halocasei]|uniref:Epoxyqueuosine reductase n=1 Tax=Psychroflexus halocasei TaxID=908615 RepID=A0A1H4CX10_9FLAO|nr:tRNA epoxyqueuosine(34) reductase QueG [Psychroflexus halocasei]SEA64898.1 epoxyqueuosine reductase [Psychroflexus halocasei]